MTSVLVLLADVRVLPRTSREAAFWCMASRSKTVPWRVHAGYCIGLSGPRSLPSEDQASNVLLECLHLDVVWRRWHVELIVIEHIPVQRRLLRLRTLLACCTVVLLLGLGCALCLLELLVGALIALMLVLVRDMAIEWVHRGQLPVLVVLLVICHGWVMVSVGNWYSDVLWYL